MPPLCKAQRYKSSPVRVIIKSNILFFERKNDGYPYLFKIYEHDVTSHKLDEYSGQPTIPWFTYGTIITIIIW